MNAPYGWAEEDGFEEETHFDKLVDRVCEAIDGVVFYRCVYTFTAFFIGYMLWQAMRVI